MNQMNPVLAVSENPDLAPATAMPLGRVLRAYVIEAKYESLRMLRAPAFAAPFLLLPVCLYLLFAVLLFGDAIAKDPKAGLITFMGFSILGVMGPGMFGFGITVAMEREQGLLKLKRALPMPVGASLIAKMLMSMLFVAIIMASMVGGSAARASKAQRRPDAERHVGECRGLAALLCPRVSDRLARVRKIGAGVREPTVSTDDLSVRDSVPAAQINVLVRRDFTGISHGSACACINGRCERRRDGGSCAGAGGRDAGVHRARASPDGSGWLIHGKE